MKILKFTDEDNQLTVGVAKYKPYEGVNNIPDDILWFVWDRATSDEKRKLKNNSKLTSRAKVAEGDTFDKKTGEDIVRDKIIIKDCERRIDKLNIISKYVTDLQQQIKREMQLANDQMASAYDRLDEIGVKISKG